MQSRSTLGALVLLLGLGTWAMTKPAAPNPNSGDANRVGELIKQLGSSKFQERNAAQKELEAIGAPALEQLKKATQTEDLETSKRAAELVRKLEERMFTANLLAPKRVHLKVEDKPVPEAVKELVRLSGYQLILQGDLTKVNDKKITLDTGDVSFWEALDQLCVRAGLVDQAGGISVIPGQPNINLPFQVRPQPAPIKINPIKLKKAIQARPVPAPIQEAVPEKQNNDKPQDNKPANNPNRAPQAQPEPEEEQAAEQAARVFVAAAAALAQVGGDPKPGAQPAAQPAKAKVQVQAQPVQVQVQPAQAQIQPIIPGIGRMPAHPGVPSNQIILVPGTPKNAHVSYSGAVRIRVVPSTIKKQGEHVLTLEVAAEPRLQGFSIIGTPSIERAIDDQGQTLTVVAEVAPQNPMVNPNGGIQLLPAMDIAFPFRPNMGQRQVTLRLKAGDKEAKEIKELKGTLTAQVITPPEAIITLDNVLNAAGQTAKGKSGGSLQLQSIEKLANGDVKVQVRHETPPGQNQFGGMIFGNGVIQMQQVQIQIGNGGGVLAPFADQGSGLPELVDAKGNKYELVQLPNRRLNVNNGVAAQDLTMVFRANNGQGEPASLIVTGTRTTSITVPFAFQNIAMK